MTLAPHSKLSTYEILAPIGAGAMGEVYRAKDTRLGREVAVKVLPEHFAADEERLKRFEREAKTLASLNHPNVAQIFGVDQVGDTCFLVLELVPGESLEDRLKRGPLPLAEALDVCRQIAEGLEAAHEAGVIHRDLKPANIRLTPDGKVKVLDFGLAKPASEMQDGSSTDSVLSTEAGRLLGTPTYMAPEQARGKSIDRRVDIWAFGCVLYECLTARRAFAGETLTDVLGAVLHTTPDLARLPADTPLSVRELVASCFEKNPRERLRDCGDARRILERAHDSPAEAGAARPRFVAPGLALGLLGLAALTYFLGRASRAPAGRPLMQLELSLAPADSLGPTSSSRPYRPAFAITSDGRRLVFSGQKTLPAANGEASSTSTTTTKLYLRALEASEAVPIPGTEGADSVFLSPDDRWAGFLAAGEICKVPLEGGPVEHVARLSDGGLPSSSPLVPANVDLFGACFDADGSIVFGRYGDGLWEVPANGGAPKRLTQPAADETHRLPRALPGGRGLLFTCMSGKHPRVCVANRRGGEVRALIEEATDARFVAPDRLLFARDGVLMSVGFDLERLQLKGAPTALVSNLLHAYDGGRPAISVLTAFFDVSASGTLVFAEGGRIPFGANRPVWVGRDGKVERLPLPDGYYARARLSPDGKRAVVTFAAMGLRVLDGRPTLIDLERGSLSRLADEEGLWGGVWSSDASRIFSTAAAGGLAVFAPDGSGSVQPLRGSVPGQASSVSRDGAWLFQTGTDEGNGTDILRLDLAKGTPAEPWIHSRANEAWPELSPDGTLLAYGCDSSGRFEVYVQPYPGTGARQQVSVDGATSPLWSHKGDELFFLHLVAGAHGVLDVFVAPIVREPALSVGKPRLLFTGHYQRLGGLTAYDISPDDQRFLLIEQDEPPETPTTRLRVVLDWLPQMRALPAGSRKP